MAARAIAIDAWHLNFVILCHLHFVILGLVPRICLRNQNALQRGALNCMRNNSRDKLENDVMRRI